MTFPHRLRPTFLAKMPWSDGQITSFLHHLERRRGLGPQRTSRAGQVPPAFFYFTAGVDLAGGLGVVPPSLTRIKPGLVVPAALGCAALQICAIVFHLSRGEAADTPFNFGLVALTLFVAWGRRKLPIRPRPQVP